jgi:hypothetical protein
MPENDIDTTITLAPNASLRIPMTNNLSSDVLELRQALVVGTTSYYPLIPSTDQRLQSHFLLFYSFFLLVKTRIPRSLDMIRISIMNIIVFVPSFPPK